jgi:hypothetical protein
MVRPSVHELEERSLPSALPIFAGTRITAFTPIVTITDPDPSFSTSGGGFRFGHLTFEADTLSHRVPVELVPDSANPQEVDLEPIRPVEFLQAGNVRAILTVDEIFANGASKQVKISVEIHVHEPRREPGEPHPGQGRIVAGRLFTGLLGEIPDPIPGGTLNGDMFFQVPSGGVHSFPPVVNDNQTIPVTVSRGLRRGMLDVTARNVKFDHAGVYFGRVFFGEFDPNNRTGREAVFDGQIVPLAVRVYPREK